VLIGPMGFKKYFTYQGKDCVEHFYKQLDEID